MRVFKVRLVLFNTLIDGSRDTRNVYIVSWIPRELLLSCIGNLIGLLWVFKMFNIIESPGPCKKAVSNFFYCWFKLKDTAFCEKFCYSMIINGRTLSWLGRFENPSPNSPDFAPNKFHLFRCPKHHIGGNLGNHDEDVKTAVTSCLSEQATILAP